MSKTYNFKKESKDSNTVQNKRHHTAKLQAARQQARDNKRVFNYD